MDGLTSVQPAEGVLRQSIITLDTGMSRAEETSLRNAASSSDILPLPQSSAIDSISWLKSRVSESSVGPPQRARRER